MNITTRKNIRQAFKVIGYKVTFQRNPFNGGICNIGFKDQDMIKPIVCNSANCYRAETYKKHEQAFKLAESFNGFWLEDTEQKIV